MLKPPPSPPLPPRGSSTLPPWFCHPLAGLLSCFPLQQQQQQEQQRRRRRVDRRRPGGSLARVDEGEGEGDGDGEAEGDAGGFAGGENEGEEDEREERRLREALLGLDAEMAAEEARERSVWEWWWDEENTGVMAWVRCRAVVPRRRRAVGGGGGVDGSCVDEGELAPFVPDSRTPTLVDLPGPASVPWPPGTTTRFTTPMGEHEPACGGRCMLMRRVDLLWATFLMLTMPTVVWSVWVAPAVREELGVAVDVLTALLALACYTFLFLTWLTEPGLIPVVVVHEPQQREEDPLPRTATATTTNATSQQPEKPPKTHTYVYLHSRFFDRRVFRAQVSRFTGSCVETFDHYCPWVGNAVGKRNYRYFVLFLVSVMTLSLVVSCTSVLVVFLTARDKHWDVARAMVHEAAAMAVALFSLILGLSLTYLTSYHLRLVSRNLTTAEDIKKKYAEGGNPHDEGCVRNCAMFCCGPHWPSRIAEPVVVVSRGVVDVETGETNAAAAPLLHEGILFSPTTPRDATPGGPRVSPVLVPPSQLTTSSTRPTPSPASSASGAAPPPASLA